MLEPRVSEHELDEIIKKVEFVESSLGYPVRTDTELPQLLAPHVLPILLDLRDARAELIQARRGDMYRAGVEAAAKEAENFYPIEDAPADISAHECAKQAARAARRLCTQPVDSSVNDELHAMRLALARAQKVVEAALAICGDRPNVSDFDALHIAVAEYRKERGDG